MKRLLDIMLDHPLVVLLVFVAGAAALGFQARHFEVDASAETLLTRDNELYIRTQVMNERFSPQEFLLIGYAPRRHPVLSRQTFDDIATLSERLLELERVDSVRSILNVPLLSLMEDPMAGGDPAEWTYERQEFTPGQMREALTGNPIYENLIINEDQTATAIQVLFRPNAELEDIQRRVIEIQRHALERELTDEEQAQIDELQARAEPINRGLNDQRLAEIETVRQLLLGYEDRADVYLGGVHVLGYQLIDIITNDLVVFGSIIAGVICLTLLFLFRRLRWVLIPIVCCGCSLLLTTGLFGLLNFKATVISANFIALQLILTLAIVIHLIVQYREYAGTQPEWNQRELVRRTFLKKVKPCFYAGLTTSVGFGSLLFTGIQPVISFGWMMIIAMFFSIAASLILFPALMVLFRRENPTGRQRLSRRLLQAFTWNVNHFPRATLAASGIALALGAAGLLFLNVENSFINYFNDSTRVHRELSFIDQELGGSTPLDILLTEPPGAQDHPDLVVTAETVQELQRVQKMLNEQFGMGKVLSVVNFTELARDINQGKPLTEYELTAIYRSIGDDLRDDLVGSFYSENHSQLRISARVQDATEGLDRRELLENIKQGMAELGIPEERYTLTNLFVLYQDILQRLFRSQIFALGFVYLVLTATFCLVFRSIRTGLIGVAPNILSTISILGIMGWFSIPLDLMTITIASIAMGIAVDDTIHYVDRYLDESENGGQGAVRETNFSVGFAILYTSAIVIMGFSLLMFSDFVPSAQFGLLTSLAMTLALVWNLSLLPVLLRKFARSPA